MAVRLPRLRARFAPWLLAAVLYAGFFGWYTDLRGPLSDSEVDAFVARASERGDDPELVASLERFFREDTGRQFLMVNAIDMSEDPPDVAGAPAGATASELMDLYMEHMYGELFKQACHPVSFGEAVHEAVDLVGIEGAAQWTAGAVFRYRSRRSFMAIVEHPDMAERHAFKLAALDKTISYPIEPSLFLGDLRLILGLLLLSLAAVSSSVLTRATRATD